jgi:hypothetical protein
MGLEEAIKEKNACDKVEDINRDHTNGLDFLLSVVEKNSARESCNLIYLFKRRLWVLFKEIYWSDKNEVR